MRPVIRISPCKSKSLPPSLFGFSSGEFLRFISVIQAVRMPNSSEKTSNETPESSKKASKSKGKGKTDSFVWSDDEVELLLKVTHEYKAKTSTGKHAKESILIFVNCYTSSTHRPKMQKKSAKIIHTAKKK